MAKHHDGEEQQDLEGVLKDFNLSPKGGVEGALLETDEGTVQINFAPDNVPFGLSAGQTVAVTVEADHHAAEHGGGAHPVFRFVSVLEDGEEDGPARVTGTVRRLNYARHGEPNGVILDTGDFVHLKPDGMKRAGLAVGQSVTAEGPSRPTVTGARVIEAVTVNGAAVKHGKKHHV